MKEIKVSIRVTGDIPQLAPIFNNENSELITKNFNSGSCRIQHHMPKDPEGVGPTCASSNRIMWIL